jgi:hypothetical protein
MSQNTQMVPQPQNQTRAIEEILDPRELYAYTVCLGAKSPQISTSTAAKFFELFLNGRTCEDIRKLNPGFSLGQIVIARIQGEWDRLKLEYQQNLLLSVRERFQQAQLETVTLLADMLAARVKLDRERYARFLQTGDESEIKDAIQIGSIKDLKATLEALMKATGQDSDKKVSGTITHHHTGEIPIPQANRKMSALQAAEALKALEENKDE